MTTILKNCLIADGTAAPMLPGDILFEDARIVSVGPNLSAPEGAKVIDCTGKIAAPGFIDAHSHNDWFALRPKSETYVRPFIEQGITTFITGNCGSSASGYESDSAYKKNIPKGLFETGETFADINEFEDFFNAIDERSLVNIATLAGHGTARISVNGMGADKLDKAKMGRMLNTLEKALQQGAAGVSLGLMYEPGIFSEQEELLEVAKLVKKYNRILTVHPKAESAVSLSYPLLAGSHLLLAFKELTDIVEKTGVRFQNSHLIFVGERTWPQVDTVLKKFEELNNKGFDAAFDMYPLNYGASVITVIMPSWFMKLSKKDREKPFTRLKLRIMIKATIMLLGFGFDDITISWAGENNKELVGKTVAQIAKEWGTSPFDAYVKICEKTDYQAAVLQGRYQNKEIVSKLMQNPYSLFMTDSWVTCEGSKQNGCIYGAMPMFLELAKENGMPIEKAIAKMTGDTAKRYQLKDRGIIAPGAFADITVFDPKNLKNRIEEALPPRGIDYVFINGQTAVEKSAYVLATPAGKAVRVQP
jgi:N-acyl-D-aspartate/D-glutamate deacylase